MGIHHQIKSKNEIIKFIQEFDSEYLNVELKIYLDRNSELIIKINNIEDIKRLVVSEKGYPIESYSKS